MKCRHGVLGKCPLCQQEQRRAKREPIIDATLKEMGRLILELADSQGLNTERLEAKGLSINMSTSRPQRRTHFMMFSAALCAPVTMCTFASKRMPLMPMGSLTSCPSITNSCGSTKSRR